MEPCRAKQLLFISAATWTLILIWLQPGQAISYLDSKTAGKEWTCRPCLEKGEPYIFEIRDNGTVYPDISYWLFDTILRVESDDVDSPCAQPGYQSLIG